MRIVIVAAVMLCMVHIVQSQTVKGPQLGGFGSFVVGHQQDSEPVLSKLVGLIDKVLNTLNTMYGKSVNVTQVQIPGIALMKYLKDPKNAKIIQDYRYKMRQFETFERAFSERNWKLAKESLTKLRQSTTGGKNLP